MTLSKSFNDEQDDFRKKVVQALAEACVEVPTCNKCREPIFLMKDHNGKWVSLGMDLEKHWPKCEK